MNIAKELDLAIRLAESISENEDISNKKELNTSNSLVRKLSCHKEGFCFEKKLPTTVGGTTSFDGFLEEDACNLFVVSKSSEPYSKKKSSASFSFGELYEFINTELLGELEIEMKTSKCGRYLDTKYFAYGEEITRFDLKQMICHLLGIATGLLNGTLKNKQIDLIYLLYDPTELSLPEKAAKEINDIYERTTYECNLIDFTSLFRTLFSFLRQEKHVDSLSDDEIEEILFKFTFALSSQELYPLILG